MKSLLLLAIMPATFLVLWLTRMLTRKTFEHYPLEDLKSRRININMDELSERLLGDDPDRRRFCAELRSDGPTPCWFPFCDCGDHR